MGRCRRSSYAKEGGRPCKAEETASLVTRKQTNKNTPQAVLGDGYAISTLVWAVAAETLRYCVSTRSTTSVRGVHSMTAADGAEKFNRPYLRACEPKVLKLP